MVGLCGTVGRSRPAVHPLSTSLHWLDSEVTHRYHDDDLDVTIALHDDSGHPGGGGTEQPVTTSGGARVWAWGEIQGHDGAGGYESRYDRDPRPTSAAYLAALYDRYGVDCFERLNGTFAAVVRDEAARDVYLVTDRFATHSLYYVSTDDGLLFSTSIQSLPAHPAVDADVDVDALVELFTQGRVGGVKTPFAGVDEVQPGSVLAVDLDTGERDSHQYWRPVYRPRDASFETFVDEFQRLFRAVLADRLGDDETYGLLLSGGSDSRLLLAASPQPLRAFHMADGWNRESRTAEAVADAAGADFELLERGPCYQSTLLAENPPMMNCHGRFTQGHATGFRDELDAAVDVVVSGLYSDCLFKQYQHADRTVNLGPLGTLHLPIERGIDSLSEFLDTKRKAAPAYLRDAPDLDAVLRRELRRDGEAVVDHGVRYESLREFVSLVEFYPFSNDPDLFYRSLGQSFTHWTPFLDNRIVDFALTYPVEYRLRYNLVDAAVSRFAPELAAIPHAATGVPPKYQFPVSYLWKNVDWLRRRWRGEDPSNHEPWPPDRHLATRDTLVLEALIEKRPLIEALPFLDWEGVVTTYREQAAGETRLWELYALVSFLNMPVVREFADGIELEGRPRLHPVVTAGGGDE